MGVIDYSAGSLSLRIGAVIMMDPILTVLIGFILGEIFLVLLISWTYEQLRSQANFPHNPGTKRIVVFLFMLIPLVIALFTLPGIIERTNQARAFARRATATALTGNLPGATPGTLTTPITQSTSATAQVPTEPAPTLRMTETGMAAEPVLTVQSTELAPYVEPASPTATLTSENETPTKAPETPTPSPLPKRIASQEFDKPTPTPPGPQESPPAKRAVSQAFDKPTSTAPSPQPSPGTSLDFKRVEAKDLPKATKTPPAVPDTGETAPAPPETGLPPLDSNTTPETSPGPDVAATPRGKIVFTCQIFQDTRRDQICLIHADGTGWRRLTSNDTADHNFPSLSPDGRSLVYAGNESGSFEIYEMDLESGEVNKLTDREGNLLAPVISPDGRMIAFTNNIDGRQSVWIINRDQSNLRQVFGPPQGDGWDPIWSPDSSRILFASNLTGIVQLFTIGIDGSNLQQVTQIDKLPGRSDWSPDGMTIATYAGDSWQREIYLVGPDGSNLRQITEGGNNLAPSFAPDGAWIVFTSYRDNFGNPNGCEIYIMRSDGSQVTRLTTNDVCDWQPRWGP